MAGCTGAALAESVAPAAEEALLACARLAEPMPRLACYDKVMEQHFSAAFTGYKNQRTPLFEVLEPACLRFRNEDVMLVVYLREEGGQLLHSETQAAPGESYLAVPAAGRYYLEIHASGGWKVWLEPSPSGEPGCWGRR